VCPSPTEFSITREPQRSLCGECASPVLVVVVWEMVENAIVGEKVVVAEPFEWEPRARCYVCSQVETRGNSITKCNRCGGLGYVGTPRPDEPMLAVDIAWSDEGHVRMIGPKTTRKRGEALYRLHPHENSVIVAGVPNRQAA
jgi:hypothetical protein